MANATAHRLGAAIAIGGFSAYAEHKDGKQTPAPLIHGTLAGMLGTLPDLIEPACHPNHRRFFHSLTFAALLISALYRLYQWKTEDELLKLLKCLGLIAGGAYLVHLAMDATTAKSLPII